MTAPRARWKPWPGPQTRFLACSARECLYGGAAGGGKTDAALMIPLRSEWIANPSFRVLVLRRETTQLGQLLERARRWYPRAFQGAKFNGTSRTWTFPGGASVRFNHCSEVADAYIYQSDEYQVIEWEELTHFLEQQYTEVCSRLRGSDPTLPRFIRATTNPGGVGHEWVFRRWGPWLNPKCDAPGLKPRFDPDTGKQLPPARSGEVLWYVMEGDHEVWVPEGTPGALSRCFIPATVEDNPAIMKGDPEYLAALDAMDPVRRAQLRRGDWLVKPGAGKYFQRGQIRILPAPPADVAGRVRYWDLAASLKGAYTSGLKLSKTRSGLYVVENIVRLRGEPRAVRASVRSTCELDNSNGQRLPTWIEQDPGQAGKDQIFSYVQLLEGFECRGRPKRQDKILAAGPISGQASVGNLAIVEGHWNEEFLLESEGFPEGQYKDQIDSLSGAAAVLDGQIPPDFEGWAAAFVGIGRRDDRAPVRGGLFDMTPDDDGFSRRE